MARYLCHFLRNDVHLMDAHGFFAANDQEAIEVVLAIAAILLDGTSPTGDALVSLHREDGELVLTSSLAGLFNLQ